MATPTPRTGHKLTLSWQMSDLNPKTKTNKIATREYFITAASAASYIAAADAAARDATAVGLFISAADAMVLGNLYSIDVGAVYYTNLAPPASDAFAFEFDQILISGRDTVTVQPVKTSLPARNDAVLTPESDGVSLNIGTTPVSTFVSTYEAIALSQDANTVNVLRAVIVK
jgi:hypothetical protein